MGEIGKITKTVKAEELPADVRLHFKAGSDVVTTYEGLVETNAGTNGGKKHRTPQEIEETRARIRSYAGVGKDMGTTTEEAVARIRALRDEWD